MIFLNQEGKVKLPFEEYNVLKIELRKVFIFNSETPFSWIRYIQVHQVRITEQKCDNKFDSDKILNKITFSLCFFLLLCLIYLSYFLAFPQRTSYYCISALSYIIYDDSF